MEELFKFLCFCFRLKAYKPGTLHFDLPPFPAADSVTRCPSCMMPLRPHVTGRGQSQALSLLEYAETSSCRTLSILYSRYCLGLCALISTSMWSTCASMWLAYDQHVVSHVTCIIFYIFVSMCPHMCHFGLYMPSGMFVCLFLVTCFLSFVFVNYIVCICLCHLYLCVCVCSAEPIPLFQCSCEV